MEKDIDLTKKAIAVNIEAMAQKLERSMIMACEAAEAAKKNEQNLAIGTMIPIGDELEDCLALFRAALALHRRPA